MNAQQKQKAVRTVRKKISNGDTYETRYAADGKVISVRRVNVMDSFGLMPNQSRGEPNTINATASAKPSIRSPLTANRTVKGITPGSGQGSRLNNRPGVKETTAQGWNPNRAKLDKLAASLDRAIVNGMDYRWCGPRVSDAMSEYMGGEQQTRIDPETAQRIEEEVNKADLTSGALKQTDANHPDIGVLLQEAERILSAIRALTQGHEAATDSDEPDVNVAAGLSGGASYNPVRETAANAHEERPEASFNGGIDGPDGITRTGHIGSAQDSVSQAYLDYINGKDLPRAQTETDAQRIARTRAAYQRMNPRAA